MSFEREKRMFDAFNGLKQYLKTASILSMSLSALSMSVFAAEEVNSIEGITEYRLENGLQVLLFPDQSKDTVTVNVTYHVGSKHENYGETGMAHLLEHLVFKGTPRHKDIPAELSSHGARPNGTTWTDRTNYYETFSATPENINWALDMEADRMVNSFIAKKDLDSEMTVVRNEFERGENSPFGITMQRMISSAYDWHNYGKSTIGSKADLENVPIERLKAFYKKYYQPDNATLVVAGKFENESMLALVDKYFGVIPKPNRTIQPTYTLDPAKDGERSVTVRRVGDVQLVGAAYHIPSGSHPEFAATEVLSELIGASATGRLYKGLVEKKLASRASGFNFQWEEPGLALYFAEVDKTADLDKTKNALLTILENFDKNTISPKEVERAKRTLLKRIELGFNSSENIALELSEWVGMGDWRLLFLHRDRIENVNVEDVQKVAEKYLSQNNRTLGRFIPTEKPERVAIPENKDIAAMLKGYKGRENVSQGEAFDASPDNIDKRTKTTVLNNGLKLATLQKKTRGESVVVNISLQMGDLESLTGKSMIGSITGQMLMRGTTRLNRQQLKDEFDKLKASVSIGGGSENAYASILTTKENLPATLLLVSEVMQKPAFKAQEFEQLISTIKVGIEQKLQDPQSLVFNEYSRRQNPYKKGDPRYVATAKEKLEELKSLSLVDIKKFHQLFYGANSMQVSIVGDFDISEASKVLEANFTTWQSKQNYGRIARKYQKLAVNDQFFDTPDKENAVFVALTSLPVGTRSEDAPALELGNYIFGGGFLNSRLATRLRQKDGLSYGAGSFINMGTLDSRASLGVYAICAPQNLSKVEQGFKEELHRVLKDGFTKEEIEEAKSGLLQGKKVSRSQDNELVGKLNANLYLNQNMQVSKSYEAALKALSAEDVHKAMKKYIKLADFSILKGGDASKVE